MFDTSLRELEGLRVLVVDGNRVTEKGIETIAKRAKGISRSLEVLSVSMVFVYGLL